MKITHVYPRLPFRLGEAKQTLIGNGKTEVEVWDEIREATLCDDPPHKVLLPCTHQYAFEDFFERLQEDRCDQTRVNKLLLDDAEKSIYIPARCALDSRLVDAEGTVVQAHHTEAKPAGVRKVKIPRFIHLGNTWQVETIAERVDALTKVLVLMEPDAEGGDLDCLPDLQAKCRHLHVVIFHRLSDKCGVVVECDDDPDNWEAEFPVMGECELTSPEVIVDELLLKGCIHVFAGMFESYKTVATIELCTAMLDKRPAFDHFIVRKQYPILYLCPDMSPELFQEYTRPFGLMGKPEFRWQKPKGDVFHSIDSPVLQRAAQGRILVLDTMLDYAQIQKAFESGEWIGFFKKLRRLINVCGCVAIIMLVHPTKTGAKSNTIDPAEYLKDSVTFGGKIDVGLAYSKLEKTSQVIVERIKGRGFKKQQFSFTIAHTNDGGNSNLDRGRFPVYLKPGEAGKKEDHAPTSGRKPNPKKEQQTQFVLQLRGEGKTFKEIATEVGIPESTARAYYHETNFKGESNAETE